MLLGSLVKACRLKNDIMKPNLPVRKSLLNILIATVDQVYEDSPQPYLTILYKALFSTAYYGLFRIGELTESQHVVKACDVHVGINKNKLMFILHSSKTHGVNVKPQIIKIDSIARSTSDAVHRPDNQCCPFQLLQDYVKVRKKYKSEDEQFFVFRDGSQVTPTHLRRMLNILLQRNRIDSTLYSSKAFRAGRASDLLNMGVSVETIRKLGRWKSSSVYTYLHT